MNRQPTENNPVKLDNIVNKRLNQSNRQALDESFFESVTVTLPPAKKQLTIRLDGDILEWL